MGFHKCRHNLLLRILYQIPHTIFCTTFLCYIQFARVFEIFGSYAIHQMQCTSKCKARDRVLVIKLVWKQLYKIACYTCHPIQVTPFCYTIKQTKYRLHKSTRSICVIARYVIDIECVYSNVFYMLFFVAGVFTCMYRFWTQLWWESCLPEIYMCIHLLYAFCCRCHATCSFCSNGFCQLNCMPLIDACNCSIYIKHMYYMYTLHIEIRVSAYYIGTILLLIRNILIRNILLLISRSDCKWALPRRICIRNESTLAADNSDNCRTHKYATNKNCTFCSWTHCDILGNHKLYNII